VQIEVDRETLKKEGKESREVFGCSWACPIPSIVGICGSLHVDYDQYQSAASRQREEKASSSRVAIVVCKSFSSPTAASEFLLLRVIRLLGDIERGVSSTCSFFLVDRGVIEINKLSLNEGLLAGGGSEGGGVDIEVAITSEGIERGRERGEGGSTRADGEQKRA